MADTPRFGIRFTHPYRPLVVERAPTNDQVACEDRVPIYRRAIELAAHAHTLIERAEAERFFLRDQLDRKSSLVAQLIAQGLALADMPARRALLRQARHALTDCATILDMMRERGSVPHDAIEPARALASVLRDELHALTVEPPKVR